MVRVIDEKTIRRQLAEFERRLAGLDDERQALLDIVKGYKTLLKTMSAPDVESKEPPSFPAVLPRAGRAGQPVGTVSMRSAVARVLRDAAGRPMHAREVAMAAEALGARTTAKDAAAVADLVILDLSKKGEVQKVAPRTWRWLPADERAPEWMK